MAIEQPLRFCVYALFCQEDKHHAYVKIGRSEDLTARISTLRTSCPIPARFAAYVEVSTLAQAAKLEARLHQRFADRHSTGEWFKFDLLDREERHYFNENCRWVFRNFFKTDQPPEWTTIDIEAMDEARRKQQLKRYWSSRGGQKRYAKVVRGQQNARELKSYRDGSEI